MTEEATAPLHLFSTEYGEEVYVARDWEHLREVYENTVEKKTEEEWESLGWHILPDYKETAVQCEELGSLKKTNAEWAKEIGPGYAFGTEY